MSTLFSAATKQPSLSMNVCGSQVRSEKVPVSRAKNAATDNNYMIQFLSCCFLEYTLDSSQAFCQA